MVKIYYDPKSSGIYQTNIHKRIPQGSVEISEEMRWKIVNASSDGLLITVLNDEITFSESETVPNTLVNDERFWRDSELFRSDIELYKVQDSDAKGVGSVSDWRVYRKLLRMWPENANFPTIEFRPKAPDAD